MNITHEDRKDLMKQVIDSNLHVFFNAISSKAEIFIQQEKTAPTTPEQTRQKAANFFTRELAKYLTDRIEIL